MDLDKLAEQAVELFNDIGPLAKDAAECARLCRQYMNTLQVPEAYLSMQWMVLINALPQFGHSRGQLDAGMAAMRSIALCMRATGFPSSEIFMDVSERLHANIKEIEALEDEAQVNEGATKQ